jgi:hypothetical protein
MSEALPFFLTKEEQDRLAARNNLRSAERQIIRSANKSKNKRKKLTQEERRNLSIANVLKYW